MVGIIELILTILFIIYLVVTLYLAIRFTVDAHSEKVKIHWETYLYCFFWPWLYVKAFFGKEE